MGMWHGWMLCLMKPHWERQKVLQFLLWIRACWFIWMKVFSMAVQYLNELPSLNKWMILQYSHFSLIKECSYKFKLQEGLRMD
jgi:hypothetical protein